MHKLLKRLLFGTSKDPLDPKVFHKLSLAALLAWVGLGADGLSSSCYGPEEAFLALGQEHRHLALFLAIFIAITVFTISAGYSKMLDLFSGGGGGYVATTKLVGPYAGLLAGSALMIDYVLTIAISVAAGVNALFESLPEHLKMYSFPAKVLMLLILLLLNLRGVRESIMVLMPIFFLFLVTHIVAILYGVLSHAPQLPGVVEQSISKTTEEISTHGWGPVLAIFIFAFTLGGGTFTGIEAVSNSVQIFKEPRAETGIKTMRYMAWSLAFTAGGILICYLLYKVQHTEGTPLNASLFGSVTAGWGNFGHVFLVLIMVSEGALLFVAAQSGFMDGPRVLASMALDSWAPRQFVQLSDRLVIGNGIMLMSGLALALLFYTAGSVKTLVVMYSVNVFICFTFTQLGMCAHWLRTRKAEDRWVRSLFVNFLAFALSAFLLGATIKMKFHDGAWVSLALTGAFMILCLGVKHHYHLFGRWVSQLDKTLTNVTVIGTPHKDLKKDADQPTAVLMVSGYNGLGLHSMLSIHRLFPGHFKNFVFVSVGVLDSGTFKGTSEVVRLKASTEESLKKYVDVASRMGIYAEYRFNLGVDPIQEVEEICLDLRKDFPRAMYFAGRLVFPEETYLEKVLHNQTALSLQSRFHFHGMPLMVLPIRVKQSL